MKRGFLLVLVATLSCSDQTRPEVARRETAAMELAQEPLTPLSEAPVLDARIVALGERLFHDPGLSSDGTVSCASCHDLTQGGDDGRVVSLGVGKQAGNIHAPTVLNSGLNFVQFWDGRAATLEAQAGAPLTNPVEMGNQWPEVLAFLQGNADYRRAFQAAFASDPSEANVRTAIATFERTLVTRGARFDRWLRGDKQALTDEETQGYALFKAVGCIACHQGENVGGNMFQRFGVFSDYFKDRGNVKPADYGRYNVTKLESDRFVFRVPSLRNVELTAPYFHDGSASTLDAAVRTMARYQLGRPLSDLEVSRIVAFLKTLTGVVPRSNAKREAAP